MIIANWFYVEDGFKHLDDISHSSSLSCWSIS